jgi:hypothetical protein
MAQWQSANVMLDLISRKMPESVPEPSHRRSSCDDGVQVVKLARTPAHRELTSPIPGGAQEYADLQVQDLQVQREAQVCPDVRRPEQARVNQSALAAANEVQQ